MAIRILTVIAIGLFLRGYAAMASPQSLSADSRISIDSMSDDEKKEKAFEAFKEGVVLYDRGEYKAASRAFREAIAYKDNWKVLYNIGQCEAAARRYGMALEAFEEYLARSGDEISVSRRDEVMAEVARLRQIVALLDIKAPDGARVQVDGVDRGMTPLAGPVMVSAGVTHDVVVALNGEVLVQRAIKLTGGQEKTIQVQVRKEAAKEEAVAEPVADTGADRPDVPAEEDVAVAARQKKARTLRLTGWLLTGVGTAVAAGGLIVGGVGYFQAKALNAEYDGNIPEHRQSDVDRIKGMSLAADILIGSGAGLATAGMILLIVHRRKYGKTESVAVAPMVAPGFAGGVMTGRF